MKSILAILLAVTISMPVFADNKAQIEKVSQLSTELANLKNTLEEARKEKRSSTIHAVISLAATGLLVKHGIGAYKSNSGGDMFPMISQMYGIAVLGVATGTGVYGSYQAYKISVKIEQVDTLINAISSKQLELEAAKRVLEQIE